MLGDILSVPRRAWALGRNIERLFELERKINDAVEAMASRVTQLETRMTQLEAGERALVAEAKAAAGAAATVVASGLFSDVVTRLTRAEMWLDTAERRLPAP